jgi:hypothetical protein
MVWAEASGNILPGRESRDLRGPVSRSQEDSQLEKPKALPRAKVRQTVTTAGEHHRKIADDRFQQIRALAATSQRCRPGGRLRASGSAEHGTGVLSQALRPAHRGVEQMRKCSFARWTAKPAQTPVTTGYSCKTADAGGGTRTPDTRIMIPLL